MIPIDNIASDRIQIGYIEATDMPGIGGDYPLLDERLKEWLDRRRGELNEQEDRFRKVCRDMLRFGRYKPTGRGKPASEYLLRSAREGTFPRINIPADINNYISLKYLVPISVWDRDKINAESLVFRTGRTGESFVFNPTGQILEIEDLVSGFARKGSEEIPIVTPVKDCQLTKTDRETRNICVAIYYPAGCTEPVGLQQMVQEFCELLDGVAGRVSHIVPD